VRRQGFAVNFRRTAWSADALGDVKDDAREAVLVDIDLLVVGDLSELAMSLVSNTVQRYILGIHP
jgi:hypothetical protein